jgi:hypothetical protein
MNIITLRDPDIALYTIELSAFLSRALLLSGSMSIRRQADECHVSHPVTEGGNFRLDDRREQVYLGSLPALSGRARPVLPITAHKSCNRDHD